MEFYQKWTDFLSFPIILNAVAHIVDVVTGKVRHNKHTENRGRVIREEVRLRKPPCSCITRPVIFEPHFGQRPPVRLANEVSEPLFSVPVYDDFINGLQGISNYSSGH